MGREGSPQSSLPLPTSVAAAAAAASVVLGVGAEAAFALHGVGVVSTIGRCGVVSMRRDGREWVENRRA